MGLMTVKFEAFRLQVLSTFLNHPKNVEPAFAYAMYKRIPPIYCDPDERLIEFTSDLKMPYRIATNLIRYFKKDFVGQVGRKDGATLSDLIQQSMENAPIQSGVDFARYLLIKQNLDIEAQRMLTQLWLKEPDRECNDPSIFNTREVRIF
jgi:hypothetical protein